MKTIYRKELMHYFYNPFGYIVVVVASLLANALFIRDIYAVGLVSMRQYFLIMYWVFVLLIPALCMRSFAEERKTGTIESLLTLPLSERTLAFAKALAVLTVLGVVLVAGLAIPISFALLSGLYVPEVIVGYGGLIATAMLFISVSLYISLKTSNQVIAFFLSAIVLFCISIFSVDTVISYIPRSVALVLEPLTPLTQLEQFVRGIIDLRAVVYFVSFTAVSMYAVVKQLEHRD